MKMKKWKEKKSKKFYAMRKLNSHFLALCCEIYERRRIEEKYFKQKQENNKNATFLLRLSHFFTTLKLKIIY